MTFTQSHILGHPGDGKTVFQNTTANLECGLINVLDQKEAHQWKMRGSQIPASCKNRPASCATNSSCPPWATSRSPVSPPPATAMPCSPDWRCRNSRPRTAATSVSASLAKNPGCPRQDLEDPRCQSIREKYLPARYSTYPRPAFPESLSRSNTD